MTERLDIILFGVTGFTGRYALENIDKLSKKNGRSLSYGVAGRSQSKVEQALAEVEKRTGINFEKVPIIIADVKDDESLKAMAKRCRIVINCCGPYRFLGEAVVKACVEEGTHHVDVSGEPQYMEEMQLKYHKAAEEKGVYIVSSCGFDSIPADLGVVFVKNNFPGTLHSVETYMEMKGKGASSTGPAINYGTWASAVYGLAHANELKAIRSKLFPNRMPSLKPKLPLKSLPRQALRGWALPFPGSDRSVINRSQRFFYEQHKERPIQVQTYFIVKSLLNVILLAIMGMVFSMFTKFSFGRQLLLQYPAVFSLGLFSREEEPNHENLSNTRFRITFNGEGWKEEAADPLDQFSSPPDTKIVCTVEGPNPGYGSTTVCLVLAAIMILTETPELPSKGGVYSPGAAFAMTSIISQLDENEVTFRVVSKPE